ncbi:hypothetical protein B0T21DRAFT_278893 [Apiosordaria backusii]|uniref:CFEM domain-containing protein n=1 Tax=Apiosordaria backusii TaxID=314023 RepID=A0AA40K767_9PEZI|nr:hypothetical protein B0T21DRAFT_278893 [Apiosordaria backusii]
MHIVKTFTAGFLLLANHAGVFAQDPGAGAPDASNPLAIYPPCAQNCIITAFTNHTFCPSPLDQECTCTSPDFNSFMHSCILSSCTIREALFTHNISSTTCQAPILDRSSEIVRETAAMLITICVLVAARIGYKIYFAEGDRFMFSRLKAHAGTSQNGLWWDDYALVFLLLCGGIPAMVLTIFFLAPNGLGRDMWAVPFDDLDRLFKFSFVSGVLYLPQVAALKLTFLFFYLRIFPSPGTRSVIWGTIIFTSLYGLTYFLLAIFQCAPIEDWYKWDGTGEGKCLNKDAIQWSCAIISIVLDVWMIGIPLWNMRVVKLHWKKKLGVGAMFAVGLLVTIVCCIRLRYIADITNSQNPTQDLFNIIRWSTIEGFTSSVCACMPFIRQVLVRFFPKAIGSGTTKKSNYAYGGHSFGNTPKGVSLASDVTVTVSGPGTGTAYHKDFPYHGYNGRDGGWGTPQSESTTALAEGRGDTRDGQAQYQGSDGTSVIIVQGNTPPAGDIPLTNVHRPQRF